MRFPNRELLYVPAALTLLLASDATAHEKKPALKDVPAPQAILDALQINSASVQSLTFNTTGEWAPFTVDVILNGVTRTLDLQPMSAFAPGFRLLETLDDGTTRELPAPMPTSYRGVVQGIPDSDVAANLFEGQLNATILLPTTSFTVQPATDAFKSLPKATHVVYQDDDIVPLPDFCGTEHGDTPVASGGSQKNSMVLFIDIGVELSPGFRNTFGGIAGAVNQATQIVRGAGVIYERDTNTWFRIREMVLGPNYGTNSTSLLNLYRNRWINAGYSFPYDVSHLFAASPSSNTIGIAWINGVCGSLRYSVSWITSNLTSRRAVFAHEVGHLFNAPHCNGINPCRIMCSSIGGCGSITSFGPFSANIIRNRAISAPCVN